MKYNVRSYSCDAGSITIRSGGSRFLYPNNAGDGTHTVFISDVKGISTKCFNRRRNYNYDDKKTEKGESPYHEFVNRSGEIERLDIRRNHKQFYSFDVDEGEAELLDYDCDQTYAKVLCTFGEGRYFIYVLRGSVLIEKE